MKRHIAIALLMSLLATGWAAGNPSQAKGPNSGLPRKAAFEAGVLIVRFSDQAEAPQYRGAARNAKARRAILKSLGGGQVKRMFKIVPGLSVVKLPPGLTVQKALAIFNKADGIRYAEPNYKRRTFATPNDPLFSDLWGLHNTGQTGGTNDADIDAPEAWDTVTDSNTIVAVIDTGVDYTHPDLADNMWVNTDEIPGNAIDDDGNGYVDDVNGYDFVNDDVDPADDHYHGTHVAGTIGAVGNNAVGVVGVCWNVKLMALKAADSIGLVDLARAIAAIEYAVNMGATIINISYGGYNFAQAEKDVIDAASQAGVLFVAAAGNDDNDNDLIPLFPASYNSDNIISVMATNHNDEKCTFSNYGPATVDLGAPGAAILSTFPAYMTDAMTAAGYSTDYETISGTSMAVPHVAGACALLWSDEPGLTYMQVKARLLKWTDSKLAGLCLSGGRLNINKAIVEPEQPPRNLFVPTQYPTIKHAVAEAHDGDRIIVLPDVYYIDSLEGISFSGKSITLMSMNPYDPEVVADTIIDCQGRGRAFSFSLNEDANSVLTGFTIRNGHAAGAWGIDGFVMGPLTDPNDPCSPRTANWGQDAHGDGKGGAIYCWDSSPTISHCVITNCIASGGVGGAGADGKYIPQDSDEDGQWGGRGGDATGDGYGGAIYCGHGSNPTISDCVISGNTASGPIGGDGGDGSINDAGTDESYGGDGGNSHGNGYGGAIFCGGSSSPTVTNCLFSNNIAADGTGGSGGMKGNGSALDPPATSGSDGVAIGNGYGGAAYYGNSCDVDFSNIMISDNIAYDADYPDQPELNTYTNGAGIYCKGNAAVTLVDCTIENGKGGGLYCRQNTAITLTNCNFINNSEASNGGALYNGQGGSVTATDSTFSGNSTPGDGGGIFAIDSDLTISGSTFGGNLAEGDGGGIYSYGDSIKPLITVSDCSFTRNDATWGGGVAWDYFDGTVTDSWFIANTAQAGAGLCWIDSSATTTMSGCQIRDNTASGDYGGGVWCFASPADINDCTISGNSVLGEAGSGGGINIFGADTTVSNCLITDNLATNEGGAISCNMFAEPEITLCTISGNTTAGAGGGVYCDMFSTATVKDCIFDDCRKHAIYEEGNFPPPPYEQYGDVTVTFSLFFSNPDGDFFDEGTTSYTGAADIDGNVDDANNIIPADPNMSRNYTSGPLGDYYLNQSVSPAVDEGSDTAASLGMDTYTTDPAGAFDSDDVDLGYHYRIYDPNLTCQLTTAVVPDEFGDTHGWVEPAGGTYYAGEMVELTAHPDPGWKIKQWAGGTVDDISTSRTNWVLMSCDKTITVQFIPQQTIIVKVGGGGMGYTADIQAAIHVAGEGDKIVVYTGTYRGQEIQLNKSVTIESQYPDNPAATIIDCEGYGGRAFWLGTETDAGTIINGFTIQNSTWSINGGSPDPAENPGENGDDAGGPPGNIDSIGHNHGGAIYISFGASPVIKNCIIQNNAAIGTNGARGYDADATHNAGRGGWGAWARGGGVYCGTNSSPTFINCQIRDNIARGGNGGDGGDEDSPDGGRGNYGGNWSEAGNGIDDPAYDFRPESLEIVPIYDRNLWEVWRSPQYGGSHYFGDYRWYSGYGGGVYCEVGSNVTFTDCTISGNRSRGGMSGRGGEDGWAYGPQPDVPYEIPSFGGGVYCAADTTVVFANCTLTDNIATKFSLDDETGEPQYHLDPYLGHGGAVCAEDSAEVTFIECEFSGNEAAVGGAVFWANSSPTIIDCGFTQNSAYQGGALFGEHGPATIIGCSVTSNEAIDSDDQGILGQGGGLHVWATDAELIDCDISRNEADGSGGGVYLGGENAPSLTNCLVTSNKSGRDGGGLSVHQYPQLSISQCTIADNAAENANSYGGGLYCSYETNVDIFNSILWGNAADFGTQIAIAMGSGDLPPILTVSYSDVESGGAGVWFDEGATPGSDDWWGAGNLLGTPTHYPWFENGYYLSQTAAGQTVDSNCVNAGLGDANSLPLGRYRYTTRTDNKNDVKDIDMGYHYRKAGAFTEGDINYSGEVEIGDLLLLLEHWLDEGCGFPDWCEGADINQDGTVNNIDYSIVTELYGLGDTMAPVPDPMTWARPPISAGEHSIIMEATKAVDNSGGDVEYQFEWLRVVDGLNGVTGWQTSTEYQDTGLEQDTEYGYRVQAWDEQGNETEWSIWGYAITGQDVNAPTPDPATWKTHPSYVALDSVIRMEATTAYDPSGGVKYRFVCTNGTAYGGQDSGWLDDPAYEDAVTIDPDFGVTFCYTVMTQDAYGNTTKNPEESESCVIIWPDIAPPTPNPSTWATPPEQYTSSSIRMVATTAEDDSGVEYRFEHTSVGGEPDGYISPWQDSPEYIDTGLQQNVEYSYRVQARDKSINLNETGWSGEAAAVIDTEPPYCPALLPVVGIDWWVAPYWSGSLGSEWHHMEALVAVDDSSPPVEYKFECYSGGQHLSQFDSPWRSEGEEGATVWEVQTGFRCGSWRLRVRDAAGNEAEVWGTTCPI